MTATQVATKAKADDTPPDLRDRKMEIPAARILPQEQVTRQFLVRLPQGMIADDLKRPEIWRAVQMAKWALRKLDEVRLVDYDEKWMATAVVAAATKTRVELADIRIVKFPTNYDDLLEDENYRVKLVGHEYALERKSDNHEVSRHASLGLAERALKQMYEVRVSG